MSKTGIIDLYWKRYGGLKALLTSPYFRISILLSIILFPHWMYSKWWDDALSIMPNILGFSLGGYAILLAFGDNGFQKIMSGSDEKNEQSPMTDVNVTFVHFIFLQVVSIVLALLCKAYYFESVPTNRVLLLISDLDPLIAISFYWLCYLFFLYALITSIGATMAILRMSEWHQIYLRHTEKNKTECKCKCKCKD
jgi:hypothetical protein